MEARELQIGDLIRITGIPGAGVPGYYIHRDTVRVYQRLIARGRSVRIYKIDESGTPWFACRFRRPSGKWEYHFLAVVDTDRNWVSVKRRTAKKLSREGQAERSGSA
jgi:hypothetical protein